MHRYTIEFRIAGQNLRPEDVTRELGINPTQVRHKGDRRGERSTWSENMWSVEVFPSESDSWYSLADGLQALFNLINPLKDRILSYSADNQLCIWCGHFTSSFDGGPVLPPAVLKTLGDFGVQMVLDTYCEASQ